jgi:hypothetical protein
MEMGMVAVDPSVVTKKEMDDIVGADFDKDSMHKRLQTNVYLYPKHVEVIEDIAPIAGRMVDEIVSVVYTVSLVFVPVFFTNEDRHRPSLAHNFFHVILH